MSEKTDSVDSATYFFVVWYFVFWGYVQKYLEKLTPLIDMQKVQWISHSKSAIDFALLKKLATEELVGVTEK